MEKQVVPGCCSACSMAAGGAVFSSHTHHSGDSNKSPSPSSTWEILVICTNAPPTPSVWLTFPEPHSEAVRFTCAASLREVRMFKRLPETWAWKSWWLPSPDIWVLSATLNCTLIICNLTGVKELLLHKTKCLYLDPGWGNTIVAYSGFIPSGRVTEVALWKFGQCMSIPIASLGRSDRLSAWNRWFMNIACSQDGSALPIRVCTCVHAGWKSIAASTDGCGGSNHNTMENLLTLWAGALQAKENPSVNKQPLG